MNSPLTHAPTVSLTLPHMQPSMPSTMTPSDPILAPHPHGSPTATSLADLMTLPFIDWAIPTDDALFNAKPAISLALTNSSPATRTQTSTGSLAHQVSTLSPQDNDAPSLPVHAQERLKQHTYASPLLFNGNEQLEQRPSSQQEILGSLQDRQSPSSLQTQQYISVSATPAITVHAAAPLSSHDTHDHRTATCASWEDADTKSLPIASPSKRILEHPISSPAPASFVHHYQGPIIQASSPQGHPPHSSVPQLLSPVSLNTRSLARPPASGTSTSLPSLASTSFPHSSSSAKAIPFIMSTSPMQENGSASSPPVGSPRQTPSSLGDQLSYPGGAGATGSVATTISSSSSAQSLPSNGPAGGELGHATAAAAAATPTTTASNSAAMSGSAITVVGATSNHSGSTALMETSSNTTASATSIVDIQHSTSGKGANIPSVSALRLGSSGVSDIKLKKFLEHNQRLREQLDMHRISVSEASQGLIKYVTTTKDALLPSLWGMPASDPFSKKSSGCCTIC